jgi:hypothetical protein
MECNGPVQEKSCCSSCKEIRISIQGQVGQNAMAQSRRSPAAVAALTEKMFRCETRGIEAGGQME